MNDPGTPRTDEASELPDELEVGSRRPSPEDHGTLVDAGSEQPGTEGDSGPEDAEPVAHDIDQQTLLWAIAGDDAAFARLIQHYDAGLCELVFAQVGEPELMDRVLASTYRRAYRALPRLRNATQPGAWLSGIAAKACAEEIRRQAQRTRKDRRTEPTSPPPGGQRVDVSRRVDPVATGDAPPNPTLRPKPVVLPENRPGPSSHDDAEGDERVTLIASEADDVAIDLTAPPEPDPDGEQSDDEQGDGEHGDGAPGDDEAGDEADISLDLGPDPTTDGPAPADPGHGPSTEQLTLPGTPPAHLPGFWNRLGRQLIAEREIPARPAPTIEQIQAARAATNAETAEEAATGDRRTALATPDRLIRLETPVTVEELAHRASPSASFGDRARQVGVVVLVLVAVASVVFLAFRIGGNAKQINRTQMTNRRLVAQVTQNLGRSQTVAATFTEVTTTGELKSVTSQLFFTDKGSYRLRTVDGSVDVAYDAGSGTRRLRTTVGGLQQVQQDGLATGPPDPHASIDAFFDNDLAPVLSALRDHPDTYVSTTLVKGRGVFETKVDLPHDGSSADRAILQVDQEYLVPTKLVLLRGDRVLHQYELSNVVLDQAVPADTFGFPFSNDPVETSNAGFQHTTLSDVPGLLGGLQPATPKYLPDGYDLAEVAVHPGPGDSTGPEGANPPSTDVISLTYRRGWETITLTTRRNNIAPGQSWQDPFVTSGPAPQADSVRIQGGRFGGTTAQRVSQPGRSPYLWGAADDVLFTITGDLTPDDLARVIGSIQ